MTSDLLRPGAAAERPGPIARILLATDLGPTSDAPTARAFQLAAELGASLLAVHVIEPPRTPALGRRPRVDQVRAEREVAMQRLIVEGRKAGVPIDYLIWLGEPGESIIEAARAEDVDLIIVGSHGRSFAGRALIGSVSDLVVRDAQVPVLVVRH